MLRNVGRIILIGVSIAMFAFAIIDVMNDANSIKELITKYKGAIPAARDLSAIKTIFEMLKNDITSPETKKLLIHFSLQCLTMIAAVCGLLAAIFNRAGFWFTIISLVLLTLLILDIIAKNNAGAFAKDKLRDTLLQLFKDFVLQIGYIIGFLILKLAPKKNFKL